MKEFVFIMVCLTILWHGCSVDGQLMGKDFKIKVNGITGVPK